MHLCVFWIWGHREWAQCRLGAVSDEKLIEALGRQFYIEYGAISAGAVVTVIPMLVVFAILRKNILQGITTSGIKE